MPRGSLCVIVGERIIRQEQQCKVGSLRSSLFSHVALNTIGRIIREVQYFISLRADASTKLKYLQTGTLQMHPESYTLRYKRSWDQCFLFYFFYEATAKKNSRFLVTF